MNSYQHYIVESRSGYEAVKKTLKGRKAVWHTTSPFLLESIYKENEEIHSLEEDLDLREVNNLAKACYEFSEEFCEWLNETCEWKSYVDFRLVLAPFITQWFYVILYKGKLLSDLLNRVKDQTDPKVVCVGDPENVQLLGLSMAFGRFDTLFSYIASMGNLDELGVFKHIISAKILSEQHEKVVNRRMGAFEKILSLLNNTPSSFFCKLWKNVKEKNFYPFQHIGLWPWPRRTFYIYKDCELLEEVFLSLLLNGGRIGRVGKLPKINEVFHLQERENPLDPHLDSCRELMCKHLKRRSQQINAVFEICMDILLRRVFTIVERLSRAFSRLTRDFEKIITSMAQNPLILTNGFATSIERLFYCFCRKRGIQVAAFDHGITLGLSEWSLWRARQTSMLAADIGIYHDQHATKAVQSHTPEQVKIEAGLPVVTYRTLFHSVQRFLGRRKLKINRNRFVLMYVAELEKNNYIGGPYVENDWQHLQKTKSIVTYLAEKFPKALIILKLYPAQRYVDTYVFDELDARFGNVLIINDMDYRFIRAVSDVVFASCPTSTLGWVLGSQGTSIFLEFDWVPCLFEGLEMKQEAIYGLNKMKLIDKREMVGRLNKSVIHHLFSPSLS